MTQLTVTRGTTAGKKVTLKQSQSYLIGSSPEAALPVAGEGVANRHLMVKALKAGGFGVKGLAGAFKLNGRAVEAAKLSNGDRIVIGDVEILFGEDQAGDERQLGGFRLLAPLGKGGMGTVYRAEQISLHREVALKVLSEHLTKDPVFVARFQAEARAAARLHHPSVVQVFDVDHEAETYFYSMELMHRGSLEDLIRKHGKLDAERAAQMISEAAQGLSYAESLHMVHRDIKPDNLMLDQHGHVKIADLGLAQSDADDTGRLQGTPHFMSPEQVLRKPLDHRSDLYALGCTFYRLVTGKNPFPRQSVKEILKAQVKEQAQPAHKLDANVPIEISDLIGDLMAKKPEDRYQNAQDLVEDLQALLTPPTRRGLLYTVSGIALVTIIVSVIYVMNLPEPETKVIKEYQTNPNAAIMAARERETAAEMAMLRLQLKNLQGTEKATALESMARSHVGTKAAATALQEATRLRAEHENSTTASRLQQQAVSTLGAKIQTDFDAAMKSEDLDGAALAIRRENIPVGLRNEAKLEDLVQSLASRLQARAQARLRELVSALNAARQAGDPSELRAAITDAKAGLDPDKGWITPVLGQADELRLALDAANRTVVELASAAAKQRKFEAWTSLREVMRRQPGVIEKISALELSQAEDSLRRFAATQHGLAAAGRATLLAEALGSAEEFRLSFVTVIGQGEVSFPGEDGLVLGKILALETGADGVGIRVRYNRSRTREVVLPLAKLAPRMDRIFRLPGADDALPRQAFLAVLGLTQGLQRAQQFLAAIDRTRLDAEPTEFETRGFDLEGLARDLKAHEEIVWAQSLAKELRACEEICAGLQAFSEGHLLSADRLVTALLAKHSDLLVVQTLL